MQSKNALVNQYRSLSLMAGDNLNNFIPTKPQEEEQDFDDISSIYTAHKNNNVLEDTLKRVRNRELALSQMEENEEFTNINKQINHLQMLDEADEINNSHNSISKNEEEEKLSNDSLGQTPEYLKNKQK